MPALLQDRRAGERRVSSWASSLSLCSRARTNLPYLVSAWLDSSLVSWKDNLSPFSVLSETRFTPGLLSPAGFRAPWRSWGGGEASLSFTEGESEASRRVVPVAAQMDEALFGRALSHLVYAVCMPISHPLLVLSPHSQLHHFPHDTSPQSAVPESSLHHPALDRPETRTQKSTCLPLPASILLQTPQGHNLRCFLLFPSP